MRKHLVLLAFILLWLPFRIQAQLAPGTLVHDFNVQDINGQYWQLYPLLEQNKIVYIEISATWCPPCWSYHNGGAMHHLYSMHGPDGDDRARVFFVEGDPNTNIDCLYGNPNCNDFSPGNWVSGTPFPIIDNSAIADSFHIQYYPSLFVVCPNKRAYEIAHTDAETLWDASRVCPVAFGADNAGIFSFDSGSPLTEVCDTLHLQPHFKLINLGTNALTQAKVDLLWNDVAIQSKTWTGNMGLYGETPIVFDSISLSDQGNLKISISEVNQMAGDNDISDNEKKLIYNVASEFTDQQILLRLKTDNYGAETYWEFRDQAGNVLKKGGNEAVGPNGGASIFTVIGNGAYGNNVIIKDTIHLPANGCYSFHLVDAYGDGICCDYGNGYYKLYNLNAPGVPVISGSTFKDYVDRGVGMFSLAVSTSDFQSEEENSRLELYPNPAHNILNVDAYINQAGPLSCRIVNSVGQIFEDYSTANQPIGLFSRQFSVADWPAGLYAVQWQAGSQRQSAKFILVK